MLTDKEKQQIRNIEEIYYMQPVLLRINEFIANSDDERIVLKESFNYIYEFITQSRTDIESLLDERIQNGYIHNKDQARKVIVGNMFSNVIIWIFLKNKEIDNIDNNIYITSKKQDIPNSNEIFTIYVGNNTQKPDVDIVIYSLNNENNQLHKCMILSLKTSLRERASQTYKWKLLMDVANLAPDIVSKYNIVYNSHVHPLVCFATINFYEEINNPQNRGMFQFFDCAFIGKNIETEDFIKPLSYLIDYTREFLL